MKDFQYSSLNIVEINEFIRKDTKVYKDLKNSLCGKAFDLETNQLNQDKATIDLITDQIKYEENNYEKMVYDLENPNLEGQSFFAKLSIKSKNAKALKKLEKDHKNTLMILNNRLKKHKSEYEDHRVMLQHIIDKIKDKGFMWQEVKKLLEEKIRQGVFNNNKPKKPKEEDNFEKEVPVKPRKPKKKILNSGSFYGDPNYYDISDLTPEQRREWEKMLKNYNYNKEKLRQREIETARMMRMTMMERNERGRYDNLLFGASDYSLFGLFRDMHEHSGGPLSDADARNIARRRMRDSGFGLSGIERGINGFANDIRNLFNPGERESIFGGIDCRNGERMFGFGLGGPHRTGRGPGPREGFPYRRCPAKTDGNFLAALDRMERHADHGFRHGAGENVGRCCRHCPEPTSVLQRMGVREPGRAPFTCSDHPHHNHFHREYEGANFNKDRFTFHEIGMNKVNEALREIQKQNEADMQAQQEMLFQKSGPSFKK
ncbi:MAG: hypothetical protein IJX17_03625 [Clostridia bacterium]|nr:hypothetical protein [Clostridia bacterium]